MSAKDHALSIIKAGLNLDPFGVGGAISSLISDYVPSSRQQALEKSFEHFTEKVADIASRIKPDAINKEEFAELFGQFEALAQKTNREETPTYWRTRCCRPATNARARSTNSIT